MAVAPDRDESPDRDDALFARAFDRLAGPVPDGRDGWAELRARVPATPSRRAPRVAVVVAAPVTVAFVGMVTRRAGEHDGPLLQPPPSTATSTAMATATAWVRSSSTTGSMAGPTSATVPAAAPSAGPVRPMAGDEPADVDPAPPPDGRSSDRAGTTASTRARVTTPPAAPGSTAPEPGPSAPAGPDVTPAPAPLAPAVAPQRVVVEGGTIVVALVDGRFGVPSVAADAGWSYEVRKAEADRIEVRFRNGDRQATARLSLRNDGEVVVERR